MSKDKVIDVGEERGLIKLGDATRMLAEVRDAPSAKKLMDIAAAAELYARKAKLGGEAVKYAAGIKLDAERRLGQYLKAMDKAKGTRGQLAGKTSGGTPRVLPDGHATAKHDPVLTSGGKSTRVAHTDPAYSPATFADMGISRKLAAEAQKLATISDADFAEVRAGNVKPSQALREVKRAGLADRVAELPSGTYRVVYADPPWKYGDDRGGLEKECTAAAAQYPTMPTTDICALAVRDHAQDDAVLFLWATFPMLTDALAVVAAWGFTYKTAFVWDKQRSNIGNYHDARAELLLIATRGSCPIEINTRPKQVQSIARTTHSTKPDEFRALIDKMYPTGSRVILFHRGKAPKNWTIWGNEVEVTA